MEDRASYRPEARNVNADGRVTARGWRSSIALHNIDAMSGRTLVSIVLPTYNRAAFLREAVASVLAQTYQDWELIIVDDGSSDDTSSYLDGLADPRVRTLRREHTGNPAHTRNAGIGAARGGLIAFLDSDDCWRADKLALQMADLDANPDCGWSYTGVALIDGRGGEIPWSGGRRWEAYRGWVLERLIERPALVATTAVVVRRELLDTVGGFNEGLPRCHDLDLWLRFAERSPAAVVPEPLVQWRQHAANGGMGGPEVLGYRLRVYTDLMTRTTSSRARRLARRQRIRTSVQFVERLRRAGRYHDAADALRRSFSAAGWHPAWWLALANTWLSSLANRVGLNAGSKGAVT